MLFVVQAAPVQDSSCWPSGYCEAALAPSLRHASDTIYGANSPASTDCNFRTMSDQSSESEQGMISHDILQEPGSHIFIDKEHSSTTDC